MSKSNRISWVVKIICTLFIFLSSNQPVRADDSAILCLNTGGHTGTVSGLAFDTINNNGQDEPRLISTGYDKSLRFWPTSSPLKDWKVLQAERTFRYNADRYLKGEIRCMAYEPKSHLLALGMRAQSAMDSANIIIVDAHDPEAKPLKLDFQIPKAEHGKATLKNMVLALAFSPNGKYLSACDAYGTGVIYAVTSSSLSIIRPQIAHVLKSSLPIPDQFPDQFSDQFSDRFFIPSFVHLKWSGKFQAEQSLSQSIAFAPDSSHLAYVTPKYIKFVAIDSQLYISKPKVQGFKSIPSRDENGSWRCLAWASNNMMAAGDDFNRVYVFKDPGYIKQENTKILPSRTEATEEKFASAPLCLAFDDKGHTLAIGTDQPVKTNLNPSPGKPQIHVYDCSNMAGAVILPRTYFHEASAPIVSIALSQNGVQFAAGDTNGEILLGHHQANENWEKFTLKGSGDPVHDLVWSQNNKVIAWKTSRDDPNMNRAFDLSTMQVLTSFKSEQFMRVDHLDQKSKGKFVLTLPDNKPKAIAKSCRDAVVAKINNKNMIYAVVDDDIGTIEEYDSTDLETPLRTFKGYTGLPLGISVSPNGRFLALGSSDQMIYLWSLVSKPSDSFEKGKEIVKGKEPHPQEPLIVIYCGSNPYSVGAGEYAAWNPETGFYTTSYYATDTVCYQFNKDEYHPEEVIPVAACPRPYQDPECLQQLFNEARLNGARNRLKNHNGMNLQQRLANRPKIDLANIKLLVKNTEIQHSNNDIREYDVNGADMVKIELVGLKQGELTAFHVENGARGIGVNDQSQSKNSMQGRGKAITLYPDVNTIRLSIVDNEVESVPVIVKIKNKVNYDDMKGDLHIIVIGINKYDDTSVRRLDWAVNDAEEVADAFYKQEPGLYNKIIPPVKLTDDRATKKEIEAEIDNLNVKPNDTIVFFVAGHGQPVTENGKTKYLFLPVDYKRPGENEKNDTGISWTDMLKKLVAKNARHTFLFVDHCFAGGIGNVTAEQTAREQAMGNSDAIKRLFGEQGMIAFVACGPGEESIEAPEWRHGAFTYALLNILKPQETAPSAAQSEALLPSAKKQENIFVWDLYHALADKVNKLVSSKYENVTQKPDLIQNYSTDIRAIPIFRMNKPVKNVN